MDVFLAVAALFATAGTLGMHAKASFGPDSVPTPYDVAIATGQGAAVVGQAALVSGEMGWLNFIDPAGRELTVAERQAYLNKELAQLRAGTSTVNSAHPSLQLYNKETRKWEFHNAVEEITVDNLTLESDVVPTHTSTSPVGEFFAPNVWYLSVALLFVDSVTALFGLLEQPDRGQRLNRGVTKFATGYMELGSALPDAEQWKSEAALLYGIDTRIMQEIAAAARSKDSRFKRIINSQAFGLELMQTALAALTVGLTICVYRALYMESCFPGSSEFFQKWAARLGMVAATGIAITMVVWVAENTGKLEYLKSEYRDLADKVPSSIPDVPPAVGALNSASTVSRFGNLNLSALPDLPRSHRESTNPSHQGGLLRDLAATPMAAATPAIRQTSTNTSPASTPGVWRPTQVNQDGGSHRKPIPAAAQQHRPAESEDETASLATVFGANGHTPIDIETPDNEPLPWAQRRTDRRVVATSDPDPQPKG